MKLRDIRKNSLIGFEFEFIPNVTKHNLVRILEDVLQKNVLISDINRPEVKVDENTFKLEMDYSVGSSGIELVTAPQPYKEAMITLQRVLNVIRRFGTTNEKTAIQPNISFNESVTKNFHKDFDPLKFIVNFNEERIHKHYPTRRYNFYAKSIKNISYINNIFNGYEKGNFNRNVIKIPESKYTGVNFNKLRNGYLEIRYFGGTDYELNRKQFLECLDYCLETIHESLSDRDYNETEIEFLNETLNKSRNLHNVFSSKKKLNETFPGIDFKVDLIKSEKLINDKLFFIKSKMVELFEKAKLSKGILNYDSDRGKFQLKNFRLENASLENVDLLNCKLVGCVVETSCEIHKCEVTLSDISDSKLFDCELKDTRVTDSFCNKRCIGEDVYINGRECYWDGNLKSGIVVNATLLYNAKVNKDYVDLISHKQI